MGGETTIVGTPERVVGLAPIVYESLVALDIEPVAITLFAEGGASQPYEEFPPYLQERLQGIEMVGNRNEPSLEAILAVKPDLIIGADAHIEIYDSLSRIAPTLIFEGCSSNCSNENQSWRTTLTGIGEAFGVESRARKVIDDYESKAANAKIALQESVGGESVMLLRLLANGFRIHGPQHSTMGHILYDDLGLALPAALPDDLATEFVPMEQLLEVDPDHLFLMKGNEEREKELLEGPIWKELSAVKNNHVYEVDVYWIRGHGAFGKNAIVDDAVRLLAGD
jgi:iron complex transport system substrate-binding protein